MTDDLKELIRLYEKVLHGDEKETGLFDCYDTYYSGCWDKDLIQINVLLNKLKGESNEQATHSIWKGNGK